MLFFRETIGRTDLPTGNSEQLLNSIKAELFSLPNHFMVYPGHARETTIAHEKNFNPLFQLANEKNQKIYFKFPSDYCYSNYH